MSISKNGQKYYRAHIEGKPEGEMVEIKMYTTVGGTRFDIIEKMDDEFGKKEKYWYMHLFGPQLVKDGKVQDFDD